MKIRFISACVGLYLGLISLLLLMLIIIGLLEGSFPEVSMALWVSLAVSGLVIGAAYLVQKRRDR